MNNFESQDLTNFNSRGGKFPTFTIAIPTYNSAHCLANAIQSAINQDFDDYYEILIVNNASTDNTAEVIASFNDPRIRVVTNPETVDLFANHNVCFREAKGEYVVFIHSDDALQPFALKILFNELESKFFPKRFILWGQGYYDSYYSQYLRSGHPINTIVVGFDAAKIFIFYGLAPSGVCFSKDSILEIGGFEKMIDKFTSQDWALMLLATFREFEFEMIDRPIVIRKIASTASLMDWKIWEKAHKDSLKLLIKKLSETDKESLLLCFYKYAPLQCFPFIKTYFSKLRRRRFLLKKFWENPLKFFQERKFIRYNIK